MGFSHQHALEALLHSNNNFDAATEYLLTTPAPVVPTLTATGGETVSTTVATSGSSLNAAEVKFSFNYVKQLKWGCAFTRLSS